ncbi:hypothetical protein L4D06_05555 [Enterovibrio makurazakiensis]|uniref:lanthionine synthetase LanC family protein n=1 Tax=Enterovibrio makurazakiensis TaxID=2910232 RepID=UPI003D21844A
MVVAAEHVGFELCRDALWFEDRCTWQTDSMRGNKVVLQTCDPFLYDGLAGIALFLSHLYAVTNDEIFKETALGALSQMVVMLAETESKSQGFYVGEAGCIYALYSASKLLDKPDLEKTGEGLLTRLFHKTITDQNVDIISGYAGQILGILRCTPNPDLNTSHYLSRLSDAMMEKSTSVNNMLIWKDPTYPDRKALTGYSHGNAGMVASLAGLKQAGVGDIDKKDIDAIVQYESVNFVIDKGNWRDLRFEKTIDVHCSTTWCHGAPGILLSRIKLYQVFREDRFFDHIKTAIRTIERHLDDNIHSPKSNLSLCHGLYGNLDTLLCASNVTNSGVYLAKVRHYAQKILRNDDDGVYDTRYGVYALDAYVPGLMGGEAGFGYLLLRLHSPDSVPSVLDL